MGKNKNKPRDNTVFKVANKKANKAKHKAKPVTTKLKKINFQNQSSTEKVDARFDGLHGVLMTSQKAANMSSTSGKSTKTKSNTQKIGKREDLKQPPDIDSAMEDLSKL